MEKQNNQPNDWQNDENSEIQNSTNDLDINSLRFSTSDDPDDDEDEDEDDEKVEEADTDWGSVDPQSSPGGMPSSNDPSGPGSAV